MDVPCAYLHATRGDLPKVYVRLSKEMAQIFTNMCPEYAICVEDDGSLVVEVLKGLYGLVESRYTWYNRLVSLLESLGFVLYENDKCVIKMGDVSLVIYVDDLLLTGDGEVLNQICDMIEKEFGDCKRNTNKKITFIGMDFEMKNGGVSVKINLDKIIGTTVGTADTPCPNHVLAISEDAEVLTQDNAEKVHSMMAKLLYISKRTRPEISFVINLLCTRVQSLSVEDVVKLERVLKYSKGTAEDELFLKIVEGDDGPVMEVYIDASYGVHADSKSHSGMLITMGIGALLATSTKQKCVSPSQAQRRN